jgi:hypothetical protein
MLNTHAVAVDKATEVAFGNFSEGVLWGAQGRGQQFIRIDQGLDTLDISPTTAMDQNLLETQYIIEIDNRLGQIVSRLGNPLRYSFLDDDNIANYRVDLGTGNFVTSIQSQTGPYINSETPLISGPRGSRLDFSIKASLELQKSNFLFTKFGSSFSAAEGAQWPDALKIEQNIAANNLETRSQNGELLYIDSIVRVTGNTTGYRLDIPVRFVKCTACTEK